MLQMTLLERFEQYGWLTEWSTGKPFNNCFLVRKPGMETPFLTLVNGPTPGSVKETGIAERHGEVVATMGRIFIAGKRLLSILLIRKRRGVKCLSLTTAGSPIWLRG